MTSPSEGSLSSGHQAQPQTENTNGDAGTAAATAPSRENPPIPDNASVPKPKRLACMICRKRKLKCDGVRPSCSTCSRLGHVCAYDEQRRKSGPKRGYVKALEERLSEFGYATSIPSFPLEFGVLTIWGGFAPPPLAQNK
jgi:hypothetical protein